METTQNAYLRQIFSAVHKNQTLAVEDYCAGAKESSGQVPMGELHSGFSRYVLTIIDKSREARQIVTICLRHNEIPYMLEAYELAKQDLWKSKQSVQGEKSPAYTVQLVGSMRGKTPAEVLLEEPARKTELLRTKNWLSENLSKYPANKKVMDAIDEAIMLLDSGKLAADTSAASGCDIYDEGYKTMLFGGKKIQCFGKIHCDFGKDNPWVIEVTNFDLPDPEHPTNKRTSSMRLSVKEMASFIDAIKMNRAYFGATAYREAQEYIESHKWTPAK